jgi:hypothetical protein
LQRPVDNPHATLLTLFMNAVTHVSRRDASVASTAAADAEYMSQYPKLDDMMRRCDPKVAVCLMTLAMPLGRDVESIFSRYV